MSGPLLVSYVLLWILVLVLLAAVFALYHHFGQMYLNTPAGREGQGPAIGEQLPAVMATSLSGSLFELPPGQPALVAFMEVGCRTCEALRGDIHSFAAEREELPVYVIVGGERSAVASFARDIGDVPIVLPDKGGRLIKRFSVGSFPFVLALDRDGCVRTKAIVNERKGLEMLAESVDAAESSTRTFQRA